MKALKTFTNLVLALALFTSSIGNAAVLGRTPEQMMKQFEGYLAEVSSKEPGPVFLEVGRQRYHAQGVIAETTTLEPEDFNLFMFNLMDRYAAKPEERDYIFNFISNVTEVVNADLEYSRALQAGPNAFMIQGIWKYGAWLMLAGSVALKVKVAKFGPGQFNLAMQQRAMALGEINKYYGKAFGALMSPTTRMFGASLGLGAVGGYIEHRWAMDQVHRHNPSSALMVLQAQLACHLSYQGIAIESEFEAIKDNDVELEKESPAIRKKIKDLVDQATVLKTQYNRLTDLKDLMNDKFFKELMGQFPKEQSWQKFRKDLFANEESKDGKCRGVSTVHLINQMEQIQTQLSPEPQPEPQPAVIEEKK